MYRGSHNRFSSASLLRTYQHGSRTGNQRFAQSKRNISFGQIFFFRRKTNTRLLKITGNFFIGGKKIFYGKHFYKKKEIVNQKCFLLTKNKTTPPSGERNGKNYFNRVFSLENRN